MLHYLGIRSIGHPGTDGVLLLSVFSFLVLFSQVGARVVAGRVAQRVTGHMAGGSMPLARVVPLMAAEAKKVLAGQGDCAAAVAALPEVEALCATVYSCGPPL